MSYDVFLFACNNSTATSQDVKTIFGDTVDWEDDIDNEGMEGQTESGAVIGCDMENEKIDSIVCNRPGDDELKKVFLIMKNHHFFMMNLDTPMIVANKGDVGQIPKEYDADEDELPPVVAETLDEFLKILESA